MNKEEFLAVIPARSGSKRVKNKNLKTLAGKPLIEWTLNAALESKHLKNILVSTDSKKIAECVESLGVKVPFLRPNYLAKDTTPTIDAIKHAILKYEKLINTEFKYIILLQPTSPLRTNYHIDHAIELLKYKKSNGIISVCETEFPVQWCNTLNKEMSMKNFLSAESAKLRSQDLEKFYRVNGAIYIASKKSLFKEMSFYLSSSIYAYEMEKDKSVDIDDIFDFKVAEFLIKNKNSL